MKLDSNGFLKNKSIIQKILNVPKYTLLFGSLLSATYVAAQISREKTPLPDANTITESIKQYNAEDYYVSSTHTGSYAQNYDINDSNLSGLKNELVSLFFKLLNNFNNDTQYTRFEIPNNYGTIKVYVDKDFSDEKFEATKTVFNEWNEFFASRNSAYKFEVVKGIPMTSYLEPYSIKVLKKSADFRSCVTNFPIGKNGEITQIGFNIIHMGDTDVSEYLTTLRHETGHNMGLADSYIHTEQENYMDNLMGSQSLYDVNTMQLVDSLYSVIDNNDVSVKDKENLIFDFVKKYGEYKGTVSLVEDFENRYANVISNISKHTGEINFNFNSDTEYTFVINGSSQFDLFKTSDANKVLVLGIKNGRINLYQQNFSTNQDNSCLAKIDTEVIKDNLNALVYDNHVIVNNYVVGQTDNSLVFINTTNLKVTIIKAQQKEESFDEIVNAMEDEKQNYDYLDSIRNDGLTYYQARIMDAIQNNFTSDVFSSLAKNKYMDYSKLGSKLEFNFDVNGEYSKIYNTNPETLVFNNAFERYDITNNLITGESSFYKSESSDLIKSKAILFGSNRFFVKSGEYYFEVTYKFDGTNISFEKIDVLTKTNTNVQTYTSSGECSVD